MHTKALYVLSNCPATPSPQKQGVLLHSTSHALHAFVQIAPKTVHQGSEICGGNVSTFLAVNSCGPQYEAPEHRDQLCSQFVTLSNTLFRQPLSGGNT